MTKAERKRQAPERLAALKATIKERRGSWSTRRVQELYVELYGPGDWRYTARVDLRTLEARGVIRRGPGNIFN